MTVGDPIREGFRRATRWRLLVLCAVFTAIPAALATIPVWRLLQGLLSHAPRAELLAQGLEGTWLPDLARAMVDSPQGHATPAWFLSALLVALLLAPALAGAMLAEAGSIHPLPFRPLLTGVGRYYARMLRMAVVGSIPLGLAAIGATLVASSTKMAVGWMRTEGAAASRIRWSFLIIGVLFFLAHLTLDAGRARMAARPDRRSALVAWFSGTWLVLRHPVAALSVGLAGAVAGPVLALAVMAVRERLPAGPGWAVVAGVVLAQVAAMAVGYGRAIRIVGLARMARLDQEARLRHAPPAAVTAPSSSPG